MQKYFENGEICFLLLVEKIEKSHWYDSNFKRYSIIWFIIKILRSDIPGDYLFSNFDGFDGFVLLFFPTSIPRSSPHKKGQGLMIHIYITLKDNSTYLIRYDYCSS